MPTTTNVDAARSRRRPGEDAAAALPRGAHLVGSVPLASAEEVFRSVAAELVSFVEGSFSTNSRPALRAAARGGRPRPAGRRLR